MLVLKVSRFSKLNELILDQCSQMLICIGINGGGLLNEYSESVSLG